ncbi:MAG: hypothetical protein N2645_02695 [Clostridia bacterium]|nr:hypothetical protein [Clostridia bacterium]
MKRAVSLMIILSILTALAASSGVSATPTKVQDFQVELISPPVCR